MSAWASYLWFRLAYWASMIGLTLGQSLRVRGRHHLPRRGALLIVANHQSFLDPVLVGLAAPRQLSFLARKTLFDVPLLGRFIRSLHARPIDHEQGGKEGLRIVLDLLAAGEAVVVFPEGTRSADGTLQALKPGIFLLIKRARVPVVVMGIAGAHAAWPRTQPLPLPAPLFLPPSPRTVAVVVGPLIPADRFANQEREPVLQLLFEEMRRLTAEAEQLRRK